MAVSLPQKIAVKKYRSKTYDTIGFDVKKGKRDEYKTAAAKLNLSLAAFLTKAADEYAANHAGGEFVPPTTTAETLTAEDRRTLERLNSLPKSTRAKFTGLLAEVAALVDKGGDWNGDDGRTS